MQLESKKLLLDMQAAADRIAAFLRNKSVADFMSDEMLRSAVYYQFTIVGEALAQLRVRDEVTAESISESDRIIGFRNQVVHGYGKINDEVT